MLWVAICRRRLDNSRLHSRKQGSPNNQIPNHATVVFETSDRWVDAQNKLLAEQAMDEGAVVLRVAVGQAEKYESGSKH